MRWRGYEGRVNQGRDLRGERRPVLGEAAPGDPGDPVAGGLERAVAGRLALERLVGYVTVYGFASGFTSMLTALGYAPREAGLIVAVGFIG